MKKRTLFLTLTLTMAMSVTSLTGCGNQAQATDETIVEETPTTEEDTIKEEIVVAGEDDTSTIENDIIEFDDSSTLPECDFSKMEFVDETKEITTTSKVPVYSADGYFVGNIKEGVTLTLTQHGTNTRVYRFKNPVSGTDYDYLYVSEKDFANEENNASNIEENSITNEMAKSSIERWLTSSTIEHTILDSMPSDMEGSVTIKVDKNDNVYDDTIHNQLFPDDGSTNILTWSTYYIELTNEDKSSFEYTIYYKDAIDLDKVKEDYQNSLNQ